MDTYQMLERPTFSATFKNDSGVLETPVTGVWKIESPDKVERSFAFDNSLVTVPSTGVIELLAPEQFAQSGIWSLRAEALTPFTAVWEIEFEVLPSVFSAEPATIRYCGVNDLMVGDLTLSPARAAKYINSAADEMEAEIGVIYTIPINTAAVQPHVKLKLKQCNALIASGRFILAQATPGEDDTPHAYGMSLLREGQAILKAISTGQMDLVGAARNATADVSNAPTLIQGDKYSAVDAFYAKSSKTGNFWSPGF